MALWLALTLYTAAFIAEIVRAGILAISRGQTEAAYALGLRPGRTMNLVILPQALRVIIPPLISQYLNLTKNSSLAIAVGYMDLRGHAGRHHAEPDGARAGMRSADDADLSDDQPDDLGGDELSTTPRQAEGALRCPNPPPSFRTEMLPPQAPRQPDRVGQLAAREPVRRARSTPS
jgi:hypothetical protein